MAQRRQHGFCKPASKEHRGFESHLWLMTREECYNTVRPCWKSVLDRAFSIIDKYGVTDKVDIIEVADRRKKLSLAIRPIDRNDPVLTDFCRALWWFSRTVSGRYCYDCGKPGLYRKKTLPKLYRASLCHEHFIKCVNDNEEGIRRLRKIREITSKAYQDFRDEELRIINATPQPEIIQPEKEIT